MCKICNDDKLKINRAFGCLLLVNSDEKTLEIYDTICINIFINTLPVT